MNLGCLVPIECARISTDNCKEIGITESPDLKMSTRYFLFLLIFHIGNVNTVFGTKWINSVTREIAKLNPYQLTIVSNQIKAAGVNESITEISQTIPSVWINLKEMATRTERESLIHPAFVRSRESALYLIFYDIGVDVNTNYSENLQQFFHNFGKLSTNGTRPKCLIVISSKISIPKESLKTILHYAWRLKFLDVTILAIIEKNDLGIIGPIKYNYNPFVNYTSEIWDLESTIFPNKLISMNGYPIKILAFHDPPYLDVTSRNSNGSASELDGIHYRYIPSLSSFFNFSILKAVDVSSINLTRMRVTVGRLLDNETVNMTPIPLRSMGINNFRYLRDSIHLHQIKNVAMIPILLQSRKLLQNSFLANLVTSILFIAAVVTVSHFLHFERKYWKFIDIVRILLSQSMPYQPRRSSERLAFIIAVLLSMTYLNETISNLMDVKIITESKDLNSLEDISNSTLNVFMEQYVVDRVLSIDDEISRKIKLKYVNFSNQFECVQNLRKNRDCICIMSEYRAKFFIKYYSKDDHKPVMKIANIQIGYDWLAYMYEESSPYVKRFNEVLLKLYESGVSKSWLYSFKYCESIDLKSRNNMIAQYQDEISKMPLYTVLFVGYAVSLTIFVAELLRARGLRTKPNYNKPFRVYRVHYNQNKNSS